MAITSFTDTFSTGSQPDSGIYTAINGALADYTVSSGLALASDPHTSTNQIEGFYTTDTVKGDFTVIWKLNTVFVQYGVIHAGGLWIDSSNRIELFRYYHGTYGWYNPCATKFVGGVETRLYNDSDSHGNTYTVAINKWYKIAKNGQTFTMSWSEDGTNYTTTWTGTISDWAADQEWHVHVAGYNIANAGTLYADQLDITGGTGGAVFIPKTVLF